MTMKSEIKKQLEAIVGHKLEDDAVQAIQLIHSIALSTSTDGLTTQKHLLIATPNTCQENLILDVSGLATTASNGQRVFKVTDFLCPGLIKFAQPINVVATAFSSKPFFLTVLHSLLNNGADVEIKIFAWNANGAAAPNVSFNWRCRVGLVNVIL